jgi:GT2 family glycosyltransferase
VTAARNFGQLALKDRPARAAIDDLLGRPRIAALVVTHNRLDQLRRTVKRLLEEPLDHLVVVNNASTDGTGTWLAQERDPRLKVITTVRNTGGAGGFEHGLRHVKDQIDPDWTVLMDDDARPRPGAIAAFRARAPGLTDKG